MQGWKSLITHSIKFLLGKILIVKQQITKCFLSKKFFFSFKKSNHKIKICIVTVFVGEFHLQVTTTPTFSRVLQTEIQNTFLGYFTHASYFTSHRASFKYSNVNTLLYNCENKNMCNSPNFRLKKVKLKELETYTPLPDIQFESVIHSVMSSCLRLHGLQPTRLLCPWDSPDKNTGVGSHSLLQGIFWTQGSNPGIPHCRRILNV